MLMIYQTHEMFKLQFTTHNLKSNARQRRQFDNYSYDISIFISTGSIILQDGRQGMLQSYGYFEHVSYSI